MRLHPSSGRAYDFLALKYGRILRDFGVPLAIAVYLNQS